MMGEVAHFGVECVVLLSDVHHRAGKHGGVLQQNHVPQWLLSIRDQFRALWNVTTPGPCPKSLRFLVAISVLPEVAACCSPLLPLQATRRFPCLCDHGRVITHKAAPRPAQVKLAEAYNPGTPHTNPSRVTMSNQTELENLKQDTQSRRKLT